jgi:hypothetical protein
MRANVRVCTRARGCSARAMGRRPERVGLQGLLARGSHKPSRNRLARMQKRSFGRPRAATRLEGEPLWREGGDVLGAVGEVRGGADIGGRLNKVAVGKVRARLGQGEMRKLVVGREVLGRW